jgi:predicted O-methyltransferase YrrM
MADRRSSTAPAASSWSYSEDFVAEPEGLAGARERATEIGVSAVGPGAGATLRFLAAVLEAKSVVEVGTGTGVSAVWLLAGMHPDGVLTSVDVEAEHQRQARATFAEADVPLSRTRLITGRALDVLPRLADDSYDIVFVDGDKTEYDALLDQAVRLLRPGGVVAFDNALWHDQVADPAHRDPSTVALRDIGNRVRDDERLVPLLLPVSDGLLVAVAR